MVSDETGHYIFLVTFIILKAKPTLFSAIHSFCVYINKFLIYIFLLFCLFMNNKHFMNSLIF